MNDMIIENSLNAAELFMNGQLSEDELYSLIYQGYVDEEALSEAFDYLEESADDWKLSNVPSAIKGGYGFLKNGVKAFGRGLKSAGHAVTDTSVGDLIRGTKKINDSIKGGASSAVSKIANTKPIQKITNKLAARKQAKDDKAVSDAIDLLHSKGLLDK